jgi:transposase
MRGTILYVALELSNRKWKVAMSDSLARPPRIREVNSFSMNDLQEEVTLAKQQFGLPADAAVCCCQEAGRDGFAVHRIVITLGWDSYVIDPASVAVPRKKRSPKTDRIDAVKLVQALIRTLAGDEFACRLVHCPTPEEEDARQLNRELETLTGERTAHVNRIKGLLKAQGIGLEEIKANFPETLASLRTSDGRPLPSGLVERLAREFARLQLVSRQMRTLEEQRADLYRQAMKDAESVSPAVRMAAKLRALLGIGDAGAWTLTMELFAWRKFKNRRQVGAVCGLISTPFASGSVFHSQGITKGGRDELRSLLVELAWCWLIYQPQSELSLWYQRRFAGGTKRQRRIGIVALARKLAVALWKYLEWDQLPAGARLTKDVTLKKFRYTQDLERQIKQMQCA